MSGRGKSFNGNRGNRSYRSSKQPQASIHSTPISNSSDKPKSLKRYRPNSDSEISQELQDLSNILDNLSNNKELLKQATSIILDKPAIKNCILDELSTEVQELKFKTVNLENRIDELEQYSRKTCLKFSGIPENVNENTDDLVINTINSFVLPPDARKLDKYAISTSHILGPPNKEKPRDIIVRFVRYRDKAVVYANKTNLKGFNTNSNNSYRIFINEALTKKRSIIYASARQAVRTGSAKGCWTIDGKIFVKRNDDKRVLIRTQEDLDTLVSRAATMQDAYCESDIEEATESTNQTRRSSYSDVVKSFPTQDDRSNDCVKS